MKCRIIDLFKTSWGDIAIIEFDNYIPRIGDILMGEAQRKWEIKGIARSKAALVEDYKDKIESSYVFDCTLVNLDHNEQVKAGEYLEVIGK